MNATGVDSGSAAEEKKGRPAATLVDVNSRLLLDLVSTH